MSHPFPGVALEDTARDRPPQRGADDLVLAARCGGTRERDRLVQAFLPQIAGVARMYRDASSGVEPAELIQEGVVGLLRALERYDPAVGASFWTYASWWVRQSMQRLTSELGRPVVLSDRALRQLAQVKDARRRLAQAAGREPCHVDLARTAGIPVHQLERLLAAAHAPRGLDEPTLGRHGRTGPSIGEQLADPRAEDAFDRVRERLAIGQLDELLAVLSERERLVVASRFGLSGRPLTLREVAGILELSLERVRQIEGLALEKLRAAADGPDVSGVASPADRTAEGGAERARGTGEEGAGHHAASQQRQGG